MKILVLILSFLNGGYMLIDGIYVMARGRYIGPPKPGPWSNVFEIFKIDVFKLGPMFIIFGILWLVWAFGLLTNQSWAFGLGIVVAIITLWYLPVGTVISLFILGVLIFGRQLLVL